MFHVLHNSDLLHPSQDSRVAHISHVDEDIVRRMTVQRCPQPLLIQMVADESDTPSKHEQPIQGSNLDVLLGFLRRKCARVTEEIDKADGNATVDIQDELGLRQGH